MKNSYLYPAMYKSLTKPILDHLCAGIALLVLSPLLLFVTLALAIANNGKPFFFQLRPGKDGKIFKMVKFKTMNDKKGRFKGILKSKLYFARCMVYILLNWHTQCIEIRFFLNQVRMNSLYLQ